MPSSRIPTHRDALARIRGFGRATGRDLPKLWLFGLVAALLVSLPPPAGATTPQPTSAAPQRITLAATDRVYVLGDSLTKGCADDIRARYAYAGVPVTVNARAGRTTDEGLRILLTSPAAAAADVWVIALGTNDKMTQREFASRVAVARTLAGDRPIAWINVHHVGQDAPINSALAIAERLDPNLHVVQFKPWVSAMPELMLPDNIHMTKAGSAWRATLYGPTFG
jgi:hypothetical protein